MAKNLSITSGMNQARVFQCPNCKETIDTSSKQCRFCSAPIDLSAAELAADALARVNQACSDASYLKIVAGTMLVFFGLSFVPFVSVVGSFGFLLLLVAVPVMAIRWWVKFGGIETDDLDFGRAKRTVARVGITVSLILLLRIVLFLIHIG